MDTVLHEPWTTDRFLVWEDGQEGKHEFDGMRVVELTGGSLAHQLIVFNLRLLLATRLPVGLFVTHEMRVRFGTKVRYPDICVCQGPLAPTTRTLTDALAVFEVLSDDTVATDSTIKLAEYTTIPGLRYYVLVDQDAVRLTVHALRGGEWQTSVVTGGVLRLDGVAELAVEGVYAGVLKR